MIYHCKPVDTYMTYEDWSKVESSMRQERYEKAKKERRRRAMYFRRQRALGFIVFALGVGIIIGAYTCGIDVLNYIGTVAAAIGLYLIVAKHMILVDEYYMECQNKFMD